MKTRTKARFPFHIAPQIHAGYTYDCIKVAPVNAGLSAACIPIELKPREGWKREWRGRLKREAFPIKCKHRVKKRVRTRNRTNFFLPSPLSPFSLHLINEFGFEILTSDTDRYFARIAISLSFSFIYLGIYIVFEKTSAIRHLMPFNLGSDKRKVIRAEMAAICN